MKKLLTREGPRELRKFGSLCLVLMAVAAPALPGHLSLPPKGCQFYVYFYKYLSNDLLHVRQY